MEEIAYVRCRWRVFVMVRSMSDQYRLLSNAGKEQLVNSLCHRKQIGSFYVTEEQATFRRPVLEGTKLLQLAFTRPCSSIQAAKYVSL